MDASKHYKADAITTQQRGKLIVMLYDGAIKFLRVALEKLEEEDFASKGVYVGKAQDIISELNNSLDVESGGDLAEQLRALYNFMYRHLSEANIERDPEKIEECISILDDLRGAWEEVAKQEPAIIAEASGDGGVGGYQA